MTRNELGAALELHTKLQRLRDRINDLEATGGVKAPRTNAPVQGGKPLPTALICLELEEEAAELEKRLQVEQEIIRRALEKYPLEGTQRKIMALRYAECRPWREIGLLLGYTERQTYRIHRAALKMSVDVS